jgi:replicative superfamily II helicase
VTTTVRGPATARRLLESFLSRPAPDPALAERARDLLEALPTDPGRIAELVLGEVTPRGRPTFEALLKHHDATRKAVAPVGRRRVEFGDVEPSRRSAPTFPELPRETRPTELLTVVEQGPQGGPETDASEYPHHRLKHPTLNAIQSLALPWVDRDVNVVVSASTSAGKTVIAELFMGEALARGAAAAFLSPLRAVSQEKHDDWTADGHAWGSRRVSILTGDYQLTAERKRELQKADVIVLTSEMLDSRSRRMESAESSWLYRVAALVTDEIHLLTMEGRGDALESGLMRFSSKNPRARLIGLSATVPNVEDIARWFTRLNGKPTVVLRSLWRPTKLTVWWPTYSFTGNYHENEERKVAAALSLVHKYPRDKFLAFVHSKKAGWKLLEKLRRDGVKAEFHNADLERGSRLNLERSFREGDLRVVVATSTLAYGVNMPARRVIVLGIHRGIQEVDPIDVKQMVGRAGRYGIDPEGDAYVLLPDRHAKTLRPKFENIGRIESRINDEDALAFHLTAEVAECGMSTELEAVAWHDRSFAAVQGRRLPARGVELAEPGTDERFRQIMRGEVDALSADRILSRLAKVGILSAHEGLDPVCRMCGGSGAGDGNQACARCGGNGEEPNLPSCGACGGLIRTEGDACSLHEPPSKKVATYAATQLGKVASWLYFSPFDVADWASNFRRVASADKLRHDAAIAWALGHVKTALKEPRMPRELETLAESFADSLRAQRIEFLRVTQEMLAYRAILRGESVRELAAIQRGIQFDGERVVQAIKLIDSRVLRSFPEGYADALALRLKYGVGWTEAELCRLPGIGGRRAQQLVAAGVESIADVVRLATRVRARLPGSIAEQAIAAAEKLTRGESGS